MLTFIAFIFVLGLLVFVHELGHFIVAKKSGIKVERFSLGFPPKILGKQIGETEYCIGAIPLGGYVKMAGENVVEEDYVLQPRDFMAASVGKRAMVILAGPLMNYITAILLFFVVYWATGMPELKPNSTEIGVLTPGAPAEKAGLSVGSKIISINGIMFKDFTEMASYIKEHADQDIAIAWSINDSTKTSTIKTLSVTATDSLGQKKNEGRIGIGPVFIYKPISMGQALKDGFTATVYMTGQMFNIIWRLISRQESL
jgi:regulator of sigma E protease